MPELAAKLGLDPEREHTLVFVRRRVLADETPVLYSTDILPLALFGGKRLDTINFISSSCKSACSGRSRHPPPAGAAPGAGAFAAG